ncbi:MAG: DNA-processing protein DprA [Treponema sp.]|jgi:DNA processing protein|nr:DNA-processing protein DprA [Treponema sp.]
MSNNRGLLDLIISLLPGLNPVDRITLLKSFENEEELYLQTKKSIEEIIKRKLKNNFDFSAIRDKADRIDTMCNMRSIKWVSWASADYPPLVREIYDPPAVLFYRGNLPNPEKSLLGMVGTRNPSPEAADQAFKLACALGKAGISVISGLALGIDAISHRGNLTGGAPGYAVLGSGIDGIYPSTNRQLAKRILDSGGAIISELAPGIPPAKWTFPARNRIISAFSRSVIIVEAPKKSGSLITASFALEQGRDLYVASSGVEGKTKFDRRGAQKLVEDGAEIIYSENDIFEKWNIDFYNNVIVTNESAGRKQAISSIIEEMADYLEIEV